VIGAYEVSEMVVLFFNGDFHRLRSFVKTSFSRLSVKSMAYRASSYHREEACIRLAE